MCMWQKPVLTADTRGWSAANAHTWCIGVKEEAEREGGGWGCRCLCATLTSDEAEATGLDLVDALLAKIFSSVC